MFKLILVFILFAANNVYCDTMTTCTQTQVDMETITTSKCNIAAVNDSLTLKAMDCSDLLKMGHTKSGVYKIWPVNRVIKGKFLEVYCDMGTNGGGWTVIQRRGNFSRPKDFFFKNWTSYKDGFGDLEKDFWLGNDNIFALTNQKLYSVRFDLKDVDQNDRYALYDTFWIDDENNMYTLHISDYSGNAGDSMTKEQNNQPFSTRDRDNDNHPTHQCALLYRGGWWYNKCHQSNLNGYYLHGKHESFADGINWHSWKGFHESLEWTEIKIRPKGFRVSYASEMTPVLKLITCAVCLAVAPNLVDAET